MFCADVTTVRAHITADFRLSFSTKKNGKSSKIYRLRASWSLRSGLGTIRNSLNWFTRYCPGEFAGAHMPRTSVSSFNSQSSSARARLMAPEYEISRTYAGLSDVSAES